MKSMIMFVTYDFSEGSSGSRVRPQKMYQAFKSIGYDVFLISGNKEEKELGYKKLKKKNEKFDFCYIEPSSYPTQPLIDYKVINYIRKRKIPIGIFYRDAYWKFYDSFVYRGIKNYELKLRYRLDLMFFKSVSDVMFFPSEEMGNHFTFRQPKVALPPAADKRSFQTIQTESIVKRIPTAIYVGGVSKRYGTELLLESFKKVNEQGIKVNLLLICRKNEYESNFNLFQSYINNDWLVIKHLNGQQLENEYIKADFGVIPILRDVYNDFAVPVKLFEYLSYRLPILTTDCTVLRKYVTENNLGVSKSENIDSFIKGIQYLITNYPKYSESVDSFVNKGGFWEHRAKKVSNLFKGKATVVKED
ncbi:glycosyltransferase [Sediminibacillus halophilus]|uniref:Glycosyltransferase involved in cell wall bisynthesis n=1 Tax=Sediminibacillus halophilus TaxID=482461 RepID=A0A1G9U9V9_9BACI|nr:glycosyltransferase [Sediminibacillus halophilus]SDM56504.1 Glycosyltransferase involved in cell wall bisynthesis [Sediminibacillus halophilus]